MAPSPAEMIGATLNGRWRLVRLVGEGAMGAVFEADGPPGAGKRAIKILHQEYAKEAVVLARFLAEGQAGRALNHPNIAHVLETGKSESGVPYLVMELLHGTPVASYVDAGQALPLAQAVHIAHGVLQALSVAHGLNIIHRDIKPDNLFLVNDDAGSFNVKVLDFGIAKVMDLAGGMGQKTRAGVLLGTPGYMSPEQIKNSSGVDGRADLWSVGVIFYELLTGVSPFPADNEFSRLTSVLTEDVKPIGERVPQLASWNSFFQRALAKDAAQRFQTADEMDAALFATMRGRVPPATPTTAAAAPADTPPPQAGHAGHRSVRPPATLALDHEPSQVGYRPIDPALVSRNPLGSTAPQYVSAEMIQRARQGAVQHPAPVQETRAPTGYADRPSGVTPAQPAQPAQPTLPVRQVEPSGVIPAPSVATIPASTGTRGSVPPLMAAPQPAPTPAAPPPTTMALEAPVIAPTHVSAFDPHAPTNASPSIEVVTVGPRGAPYWVVVVVALCTFAAGLGLGFFVLK